MHILGVFSSCSNLSNTGGVWSSNRGRWIDVSPSANLDGGWIRDNKFELDNPTTRNTAPTDVIHLGAAGRVMILNNTFAPSGGLRLTRLI